jgi:hypothetical protein
LALSAITAMFSKTSDKFARLSGVLFITIAALNLIYILTQ